MGECGHGGITSAMDSSYLTSSKSIAASCGYLTKKRIGTTSATAGKSMRSSQRITMGLLLAITGASHAAANSEAMTKSPAIA
jgi:hypothetical protein